MLQFKTYGRGRSLEQFCRDEAVDYNWLCKAKDLYGTLKNDPASKSGRRTKSKSQDLIRLHYENDVTETDEVKNQDTESDGDAKTEAPEPVTAGIWQVAALRLITPSGMEMEIKASDTSAVMELLATLAAGHA